MNPMRNIAVTAGVLFIIATVAALVAAALVPVLTSADYLIRVAAQTSQVAAGALFYLIAAFGSVGIAIALYPALKGSHAGLARGSVVFRTLEAAMYMVAVASLLCMLTVGQRFITAGAADRTSLQAIGDALVSLRDQATLSAVFAFCLGAFLYYYAFFRSRLIPRWLSGFGIVAIILMLAACLAALFSGKPVTGYVLLVLPIAVQEMVLAVWLLVKGFSPSAIGPESAQA
jgi:hypothetical protein